MLMKAKLSGVLCALVLSASVSALTGCNDDDKLIKEANIQFSEDLETVSIDLIFSNKIRFSFDQEFGLKQYGTIYIQGYDNSRPFQIGAILNTDVVRDNDFAQLNPTTTLPNGAPIGISTPVVEIIGTDPISGKFDLAGYIDVYTYSWLGVGAMFSFADNFIPRDLTLSNVFLKDANGAPTLIGHLFGAKIGEDGSIQRSSGMAIFANFRALVSEAVRRGSFNFRVKPTDEILISGADAHRYIGRPDRLRELQERFIEGLNSIH